MKSTSAYCEIIIINNNKQILLLHRSKLDIKRPLQWDLPGGKVEAGEEYKYAATRELQEESGLIIPTGDLSLVYTTSANTKFGNMCWLFFVAKKTDTSQVKISSEHDKYIWVDIDQAIELIIYDLQNTALKYIKQYVLA